MKTAEDVVHDLFTTYAHIERMSDEMITAESLYFLAARAVEVDRAERQRLDTILGAIKDDRAQHSITPENDGTVHAAVIDALEDRRSGYDMDDDRAERERVIRAVAWIEAEPDEFWGEFAGPMLDDIERKFS